MVSPFTFYRGAAKIMAADLKDTPTAGLDVQLCGDAHLSNFGVFASPERTLLFDLNDFDETLPGPFEYDVKRMAASFTIAARNNGFAKSDARAATLASVTAYREAMARFAEMGTLDIWYAHLSEDELLRAIKTGGARARRSARQGREQGGREGRREGRPEGAHPRQPAGAVEARRDGRRPVPDRQPAADRRARCATWRRRVGLSVDEIEHVIHEQFRALPRRRCRMIGAGCSSASRSSTWPARSSASAASARGPSSSCSRVAIRKTRSSCRSRRRPRRCSRTTCRRAATRSPANEWSRASG